MSISNIFKQSPTVHSSRIIYRLESIGASKPPSVPYQSIYIVGIEYLYRPHFQNPIRTSSLLTPTPHNSTYHFDSSFCTCGEIILRSQANHVVELPCTSSLCFSGGS
ncbi:hypothetical protein ABKN59_003156 [Abortiporus biennis]